MEFDDLKDACPACGGSGFRTERLECHHCRGTGYEHSDECFWCDGAGYEEEEFQCKFCGGTGKK